MAVSRKAAYSQSIYLTNIQLLDWFNEIPVNRYDENNDIVETYAARCVFAKKDKICFDLAHGNPPIYANKLPLVAIERVPGQLSYDKKRESGYMMNRFHYYDDRSVEHMAPQPINLDFKVTVFTKLEVDMEQLVEHISFWFRPYIKVRAKVPGLVLDTEDNESKYDMTVIWDGNTDSEIIGNNTNNANAYLSTTFNLKVETWNWRFTEEQSKIILKVFNSFRTWNDLVNNVDNETMTLSTFGATAVDLEQQQLSIGNVMVSGAPELTASGVNLPPLDQQYYADNLGNITFGDITTTGGSIDDLDTIYTDL